MRTDVEREVRERRAEIQRSERRLIQKEESVDRKLENIEKKRREHYKTRKRNFREKRELEGFVARQIEELEKDFRFDSRRSEGAFTG